MRDGSHSNSAHQSLIPSSTFFRRIRYEITHNSFNPGFTAFSHSSANQEPANPTSSAPKYDLTTDETRFADSSGDSLQQWRCLFRASRTSQRQCGNQSAVQT